MGVTSSVLRFAGIETMEVKTTTTMKFRRLIDALTDETNIAGSCANWYRNGSGTNYVLWPTNTIRYWWMTRTAKLLADYKLTFMD